MTSFSHPLAANQLLLPLLLLASSVVKATLNLTLHYELTEDSPPGTVIGKRDCCDIYGPLQRSRSSNRPGVWPCLVCV